MKRKIFRVVSLICAIIICCLSGGRTNQEVWAMEAEGCNNSNYVVLNVISYDEETNRSLAVVSSTHKN